MSKTSFLSVLCRPSIPKMFRLRDIISNAKLFQGVWRAISSLYSSALQQLKSNQKQSSSENSRKKRGNWFPSVFACFREHLPHNFRSPCTLILFISRSIILTRSRTFSYHIRFGDKNSLDCIDCLYGHITCHFKIHVENVIPFEKRTLERRDWLNRTLNNWTRVKERVKLKID